MNKAQKKAWLRLVISLATLVIASIVTIYVWSNGIDVYDFSTPKRIRHYILLGVLSAIPLILIAATDCGWKKVYDERDKLIDLKAVICGAIGAFVFLSGAGTFLVVATKMGSIKAVSIMLLIYLACFVGNLVTSTATLIQYGRSERNE